MACDYRMEDSLNLRRHGGRDHVLLLGLLALLSQTRIGPDCIAGPRKRFRYWRSGSAKDKLREESQAWLCC